MAKRYPGQKQRGAIYLLKKVTYNAFYGEFSEGFAYRYMDVKIDEYDEGTGRARMKYCPAKSITYPQFSAWVNQSINQAANHHFEEKYKELQLWQQAELLPSVQLAHLLKVFQMCQNILLMLTKITGSSFGN